MQIRMDPKRLRRRVELAKIKARSHDEREWLLYQARYREAKRKDAEDREAGYKPSLYVYSHASQCYQTYFPRPSPNNLDKYEKLCDKAEGFVEVDEQEWAEIERWRLAPFASHPANAEAFPEIAPSPPDRA